MRRDLIETNIAPHLAVGLRNDTYVDDGGAWLDPVLGNETRFARGGYDNIGLRNALPGCARKSVYGCHVTAGKQQFKADRPSHMI